MAWVAARPFSTGASRDQSCENFAARYLPNANEPGRTGRIVDFLAAVRVSVLARKPTHRRNAHPIGKGQVSNFSYWFIKLLSVLLDTDINRNHRLAARLVDPISRMSIPNDLARLFVPKIQRLAAVIEVFPAQAKEIGFDLPRMRMFALDVLHAAHN